MAPSASAGRINWEACAARDAAECFIQQGELGGFAGTVAAFDHDNKPAATGRVGGKILRIGGVAESIHHL